MGINPTDWAIPARRDVLRILLGAGAAGLTKVGVASALVNGAGASAAELFAFRAPTRSALVFAVALPADRGLHFPRMRMPLVRIHADSRSWTAGAESAAPRFAARDAPAQVFVGRVARLEAQGEAPYHLVVVSAPAASFPAGELAISAEILDPNASRTRIGNPIVAELLAGDAALSRSLRRAYSEGERGRFTKALANLIAAKSLAAGHPDPRGHGETIAAMLASDTLSFNPGRPEGFTFAGQNGRRPFDATIDVVDTLLTGVAAPRRSPRVAFVPSDEFPYFMSAVA